MRYQRQVVSGLLLFFGLSLITGALAQTPAPRQETPQEKSDRLVLEVVLIEREHKQCRQELSNMWRLGNDLEKQVQDLTAKLKALEEQSSAPAKKK